MGKAMERVCRVYIFILVESTLLIRKIISDGCSRIGYSFGHELRDIEC